MFARSCANRFVRTFALTLSRLATVAGLAMILGPAAYAQEADAERTARKREPIVFTVDVAEDLAGKFVPTMVKPDGRSVAFFRPAEGLVVRDLAQGTERIFASNTQLGVAMVRHLGFSPDGRQLAFSGAQRGQGGTRWRIGVIDFDEGLTNARLTVVDETGEARAFVGWTATGQELLLARGTPGDPKLGRCLPGEAARVRCTDRFRACS